MIIEGDIHRDFLDLTANLVQLLSFPADNILIKFVIDLLAIYHFINET